MSDLPRIAIHFNQRFAHWGIQLPPADLAQRHRTRGLPTHPSP